VANAFGVEHTVIAKRKTVPDYLTPILPGSTVKAYDRSERHKYRAAGTNLATRIGAGAVGGSVGLAAAAVAGRKLKPLREGIKVAGRHIQGGTLRGWTASTLAGAGATSAGGVAAGAHLEHVKKDPKYRYR